MENESEPSNKKQCRPQFRWSPSQTQCLLEFLVTKVNEGDGRVIGNVIKSTIWPEAAAYVNQKYNCNIEPEKVNNHFRTLRARWIAVDRIKVLSGTGWDEDRKAIIMDEDVAKKYIEAHPKAHLLINRPIEHYDQLSILCGGSFATGQFAKISRQPLASHENAGDDELGDSVNEGDSVGGPHAGPRSMSISNSIGRKSGGSSRKAIEKQLDMLEHMTDAVKGVANALKERNTYLDTRALMLKNAMEPMIDEGFSEEHIEAAIDHLALQPPLAANFIARDLRRKVIWMRKFVHNHCED